MYAEEILGYFHCGVCPGCWWCSSPPNCPSTASFSFTFVTRSSSKRSHTLRRRPWGNAPGWWPGLNPPWFHQHDPISIYDEANGCPLVVLRYGALLGVYVNAPYSLQDMLATHGELRSQWHELCLPDSQKKVITEKGLGAADGKGRFS